MTSSSNSSRSSIIDYTYHHVNALLSGHREGTTPEQITRILESRLDKLKKLSEPFDKPSEASKKKIEGGSVELADGVVIQVEEADKEVVWAISGRFQIDQVDSLVLLRSFLYNEGLPQAPDSDAASSLVEELINAITPFYFSERLNVLRVLISLLRARESKDDPFHNAASNILSQIVAEPSQFAISLISEYLRKTQLSVPDHVAKNPRTASQWAKQNAKEQLGLVEVIFWMLWDYVPCNSPVVVRVFEAAYETEFGHNQENTTLMLDEEGTRLQRDIAALWILVTVEVLNLENVADGGLELTSSSSDKGPLSGSPASLQKIHNLVLSHTHPGYVCTFLAWALFLKGLCTAGSLLKEIPQAYAQFFTEIGMKHGASYAKTEEQIHTSMVAASLKRETGLLNLLLDLLTDSPLFVTAVAWKASSTITDPNAIAYRSVLKGLIISLIECQPVEFIPDFDSLVEVWIALFGKSESVSVAGLCRQYWDYDWRQGNARRAIIDVARSRFPVHFKPLIRLLRAMTGAGSVDAVDAAHEQSALDIDRQLCSSYVFHYLRTLSTYTQVLSAPARTGANALYDRMLDRPGPSSTSGGTAYTNLRPIRLPGGSILPPRSVGRLMCSDSSTEPVVVAWQHQHSGWKILVDVFVSYINRRHGSYRTHERNDQGAGRRSEQQITLQLEDIGIEGLDADEEMITDALGLVLSIIQGNPAQTEALMESLEEGGPVVSHTAKDSPPPDLVQLIIMILEDALSRSQTTPTASRPSLIAPALSVLSALLSLPNYSNRVWLYLRSTSVLFGSERNTNFTSAILAAERVSGQYVMTLALLRLVHCLFEEAIASVLLTQAEQPRLQAVKDEVLHRALRFIHDEIWVEYSVWRYARLGDKFTVGGHVVAVFSRVAESLSAVTSSNAFAGLSEFVSHTLISQATTSTITPLVNAIATGRSLLSTLHGLRRFAEVRQLTILLESSLSLTRLILNLKPIAMDASKLSLLEQTLCTDVSVGKMAMRSRLTRVNPVDVLAGYIRERELGPVIPLEAVRVLTALCSSLSACSPAPPAIIGHLSDAQGTVAALVRIVQHPYDDLALRNAIWAFICIAIDKDPALAGLFVYGQFRVPDIKGKGKEKDTAAAEKVQDRAESTGHISSAVEAACETLAARKELWEANPRLLASVMRFLDVVWQHGLEHRATLEPLRTDKKFWSHLSAIVREELGPMPDYVASNQVELDDGVHSDLHDAVSIHAYRTMIKSHALHVIGSDIALRTQTGGKKPASFEAIESMLKTEESFADVIAEAVSSSYDPELHDNLVGTVNGSFAPLNVDTLRVHEPLSEREYGDNFMFSIPLLRDVIRLSLENGDHWANKAENLQYLFYSVNLNLSLAHAQSSLLESWSFLLQRVKGQLRGDAAVRIIFMTVATAVSRDIAAERRSGDMMTTVHGQRLSLLLAILEVAWFAPTDTQASTNNLMLMMGHVEGIMSSDTFPIGKSFIGAVTNPFHRTLLQVVYFCARSCRHLARDSQSLRVDYRLTMGQTLTSILVLVIDALRLTFDSSSTRLDAELDKDMELLVAVFEQCTRPGLHTSSTAWLTRCQETDVIQASLALLGQIDIASVTDQSLPRNRGQSLYSPHILLFHIALATIPFAAERLASEGVVATYSKNSISVAISVGAIDVVLPELPGERSPAHRAYCMMLSNVTGIVSALVSPHHFITSQLVGFVQLYGQQISRALSWNNDEPLTLPFLEELELAVELFYLMADGSTIASRNDGSFTIFRIYTDHALQLLQQLNYALTHPKHLAGLLEPVTTEERVQIERETADVSVNTLKELIDPSKRPLLVRVIRRLFHVTTQILSTLNILSGAEIVLISDPEEWLLHEALVVPHSKVSIQEPASIGTLLELGNCAYDILRFLSNQKVPAADNPASTSWPALDTKSNARAARQALEAVLMYAATQLVMWLVKHDGEQPGEAELDDQPPPDGHAHSATGKDRDQRRLKRTSLTLADRLRRGMTGEMTADLQTLIAKAKPVIAKSTEILGQECLDLTQVLANFMDERVISPQ